jgi:hypothetical protein
LHSESESFSIRALPSEYHLRGVFLGVRKK